MEQGDSKDLIVRQDGGMQLYEFETRLLQILKQYNLPTEGIFVGIDERDVVFKNVSSVLPKIPFDKRPQSVYLSKFVAAVVAGLFDAALNYLWDETIFELRRRVGQYDISYFYDNAISNVEKRKKLISVEDLEKIEDSELILGAQKIGLVSDLGYKNLDHIRYMRNWASAAHPNQNDITGLQLIGWVEICIKDVISLPLSSVVVEIKQLLANIKSISIDDMAAQEIATSSHNFSKEQVNNLAQGLFGIYVRADTTPQTRQNIRRLLPLIWERVDEQTRQQLGLSYGKYASIGDQERKKLSRELLELVLATSYIADEYRSLEIDEAIDNLLLAHRAFQNFHNEPPFARALQRIVGEAGKIPNRINKKYVLALVEVFLTNGNGTAWNAEPIYISLINLFNANQALVAILSFKNEIISSKLQHDMCQTKYRELLQMLKTIVSQKAVYELIEYLEEINVPFDKMRDHPRIEQKVANWLKIADW